MSKKENWHRIDFDGAMGMTLAQLRAFIESVINDVGNNGSGGSGTGDTGGTAITMTVTPDTNLIVSGYVGSTITGSIEYTLTNTSSVSVDWTITKNVNWVLLSSASGTLAAGANTVVTVSLDSTAVAEFPNGEFIDVLVFNANGQTFATKIVRLSLSVLALNDVIRGSYGPIKGSGGSVTFTIPDWVQEGDGMVFIMGSRVNYTDADYVADPTVTVGIDSHTDWETASAFISKAGHTIGFYYWTEILIAEIVTRAAGSSEAGTEYTFTFHHDTETHYYYLLVFNGDYMLSDVLVNGDIQSAYHDGDGYQDEGITNFYIPSLSLYSDRPAVVAIGAIDGNMRVTTPAGWSELCDIGDSNVSLFVMAKMMAGTTGTIQAFMDDSDEYFASLGFESESL